MKRSVLPIVLLWMLLFSSCEVRDILPNDLSDPEHARYVASGDKARDRREWRAYVLVCFELLRPSLEIARSDCLNDPQNNAGDCDGLVEGGVTHTLMTLSCANGLTDYSPGAVHKREFWDEMRDF